jgi:hypothetical protein
MGVKLRFYQVHVLIVAHYIVRFHSGMTPNQKPSIQHKLHLCIAIRASAIKIYNSYHHKCLSLLSVVLKSCWMCMSESSLCCSMLNSTSMIFWKVFPHAPHKYWKDLDTYTFTPLPPITQLMTHRLTLRELLVNRSYFRIRFGRAHGPTAHPVAEQKV